MALKDDLLQSALQKIKNFASGIGNYAKNQINYQKQTSPVNRAIYTGLETVGKPVARTLSNIGALGSTALGSAQMAFNRPAAAEKSFNRATAARQFSGTTGSFGQGTGFNTLKTGGLDAFRTLLTGKGLKSLTPTSLGLSGILGGGVSKLTGGDFATGFGRGAGSAPQIQGFVGATNPLLAKAFPGASGLTSRLGSSALNVAQGVGLDVATGAPTTAGSVAFDVATGFAGGPSQFEPSQFRVGKNTMDEIVKADDMLANPKRYITREGMVSGKNKAKFTALEVKRIKQQATDTLDRLAGKFLPDDIFNKTIGRPKAQAKALVDYNKTNKLTNVNYLVDQSKTKVKPEPPKVSTKQTLPWEEPDYVTKPGTKTKGKQRLKIDSIKQTVKQLEQGSQQIVPPEVKADIAKIEKLVPKKVNLLDWIRTPDRVLKKIGLEKEAVEIRKSYDGYLDQLPVEIGKITKWYDQVKGSPDVSRRLFKHLDGQKVDLSPKELKIAGEMQTYLKGWADKLDLPYDSRIANYITHIFEKDFIKKDFDEDLAKIIADKIPGSVYDPFLQKRLGKQGYKEDVFKALDAYVKRATRKFNMDPSLKLLQKGGEKLPLESWNYVKSYADRINLRPTQIDNYLDQLVKQSPIGYKLGGRPVASVGRKVRQQVYRGTLGLNIGSALRNLTQGVNTYAKLGEKYTGIGYMKAFKEIINGGDELTQSGVLRDSFVQDRQLSAVKGAMEKMDKGLFSLFNFVEKINRGSAYFGAKEKALAQGLPELKASQVGVDAARDTQFTFGSVDTPVAMQSDIVKTFTQFQSFNVKQTEFLAEMIKNKEFGGLIRWTGANLVIMATVGKLLGMDLQDMVPFGNILTGDSKLGETPPIKLAGDIYKASINAPDRYGNVSEENVFKRVAGALGKNAPAFIPAGSQIKKTIQGIKGVSEEGSFSKSGRLQYPIEKTPSNYARAGLFGKYNLPVAQQYFKDRPGVLGEKQTELFKQVEDKKGFYETIISGRKTKAATNEVKDAVRESGATQQVGDDVIYFADGQVRTFKLGDLDKIADMPSANKYETAIKEGKQFSKAATILDNEHLTDEQKTKAMIRLGIDEEQAKYYQVANDSTNLKTLYVLDSVSKLQTRQQLFSTLVSQRQQVNGKMIASNSVLDNLVDEGLLTKAEAKQLKKYKSENGKLTPIKKTGTKGKKVTLKKVTVKRPTVRKVKLKKSAVSKIKTRKFKPVRFTPPTPLKVKKLAIKQLK